MPGDEEKDCQAARSCIVLAGPATLLHMEDGPLKRIMMLMPNDRAGPMRCVLSALNCGRSSHCHATPPAGAKRLDANHSPDHENDDARR
jgi:hypothetical protein